MDKFMNKESPVGEELSPEYMESEEDIFDMIYTANDQQENSRQHQS